MYRNTDTKVVFLYVGNGIDYKNYEQGKIY